MQAGQLLLFCPANRKVPTVFLFPCRRLEERLNPQQQVAEEGGATGPVKPSEVVPAWKLLTAEQLAVGRRRKNIKSAPLFFQSARTFLPFTESRRLFPARLYGSQTWKVIADHGRWFSARPGGALVSVTAAPLQPPWPQVAGVVSITITHTHTHRRLESFCFLSFYFLCFLHAKLANFSADVGFESV